MKPELLSIGPLTVYSYGLMMAIGIISAYFFVEYILKHTKRNPDLAFTLLFVCVPSGLIGSKLLYYITTLKDILANPKLLLNISDGFVIYGGIIGGVLGYTLMARAKKESPVEMLDIAMPALAAAQGFGRIGCFLAGCCYGLESTHGLHVTFPVESLAPSGIPLFPIQIVSSLLDFINAIALFMIFLSVKKRGITSACYFIFYSVGRFIVEFFRGDLIRGKVGVLTTSQFISIFIFIGGVALLIYSLKFGKDKVPFTSETYVKPADFEGLEDNDDGDSSNDSDDGDSSEDNDGCDGGDGGDGGDD